MVIGILAEIHIQSHLGNGLLFLFGVSAVFTVSYNDTVFDLDNSLLHPVDHVGVVRTYDYRRSGSVYIKKKSHDILTHLRVKVTRRLVRDNDLGVVKHSTCYGYSLLLTAGELLGIGISLILKSDDIKNELNLLVQALSGKSHHLACERYVLCNRLGLDKSEVLEDHSDLSSQDRDQRSAHVGNGETVYCDSSFGRSFLAVHALEDSRLTRTGFTYDEYKLSVVYQERYSL